MAEATILLVPVDLDTADVELVKRAELDPIVIDIKLEIGLAVDNGIGGDDDVVLDNEIEFEIEVA